VKLFRFMLIAYQIIVQQSANDQNRNLCRVKRIKADEMAVS